MIMKCEFKYLGGDKSIRAIIFTGDHKYPDGFFILTYSISIISAAFGLAKFMKTGVTRTIAPGGLLDGFLSIHFLVAFICCGFVLVARGSVFGIVTVNYGNNNEIEGRDVDDLVEAGVHSVTVNEINLQKKILEFLITNNVSDIISLNKLLVHCDEFGGFQDRIYKCLNRSVESSSSRLKRSTLDQPTPNCKEGCRYSVFKKRCVKSKQASDVDCDTDTLTNTNIPVPNEELSTINEDSQENFQKGDTENVINETRTENILKLKTHGSPLEQKVGTFLILFVPQFILALVLVIDVRSGASWKILIEQPSLLLMPVFTHFTFARLKLGCCQNDETDNRIVIDKFFTIINIVLSIISYVIVFITAHFLLDSEDWGWHLTGEDASILSQLLATVPLILFGMIFTIVFLYFGSSCCHSCCDCPGEEILVYDPEQKEQELIYENGKIKFCKDSAHPSNSQDVELVVVNKLS